MISDFGRPLREILEDHRCTFVRHGKGDHDIWYSPITDINFSVPVHIKSRHTANGILKQAGIPKAF